MGKEERLQFRDISIERQRRFDIAEMLREHGVPIQDISFPTGRGALSHVPTGEYFVFTSGKLSDPYMQNARRSGVMLVDEWTIKNPNRPNKPHGRLNNGLLFEELIRDFHGWCEELRAYLDYIGRYAGIDDPFTGTTKALATTTFANASSRLSNDPILPSESERLRIDIEGLKQFIIANGSVSQEHLSVLDDKMAYLIEASERVGRKDWVNLLLATLMTIIITGLFDPNRSKELMDYGVAMSSFLFQALLP